MSWKDDIKRDVREVVREVVREEMESISENVDYKERYDSQYKTLYEVQQDKRKLQEEINQLQKERPSEFEKDQWAEAAKQLKKLSEVKKNAYNEGYAAAYVDVTNRMKAAPAQNQAF